MEDLRQIVSVISTASPHPKVCSLPKKVFALGVSAHGIYLYAEKWEVHYLKRLHALFS